MGATADRQDAAEAVEPVHCCVVYQDAIELVGRRWTGAIISVLLERPLRNGEIEAAVPDLSARLLSARLNELEERGLIERTPCPQRKSSSYYALTEMGRDLAPAIDAISAWAEKYLAVPQG